ncbi:MAG: hypothetical protein AB7K71_16500 [Polyangiaceae bacterium]
MRRPLTAAIGFAVLLPCGNLWAQPAPEDGAPEPPGAEPVPEAPVEPDPGPPPQPPAPQPPALPTLVPPPTPPQVFRLKNGSSVQGWVVESHPGQELIILTEDGWTLSVPWQHVGPPPATPGPDTSSTPDATSAAEEKPRDASAAPTGIRLGARAGVALPFGSIKKNTDLSDGFGIGLPLILEVGGQTSALYFGVYAGYQANSSGKEVSDDCDASDCSLYGIRLGLTLEGRFADSGNQFPWASYSIGFAGDEIDVEEGGVTRQHAWGGIDFATILAGLDFRVGDRFLAGPFGGVSLSYYIYDVDAIDGRGETDAINHGAVHGWIQLGARAAVLP